MRFDDYVHLLCFLNRRESKYTYLYRKTAITCILSQDIPLLCSTIIIRHAEDL